MQTDKHSRRNFIKKAAVGAVGIATLSARSYDNILGANDRINIAIVGLNGRGQGHIRAVANIKNVTIKALCDVDSRVLTKSVETVNKWTGASPKTFGDIRKLLQEKDLDAITIATPDHWHTPMAMMAMQAGKHVYLEKPCTFNAQEGEWLVQSKNKHGKVLQIGNQQRSAPTSIQGIEDIKNGIIGDVYFGKAWYANTRGTIGAGKKVMVPKWLDWEMWQGPAPKRAFSNVLCPVDVHRHFPQWRRYQEYAGGSLSDMGAHHFDIAKWAMDLDETTPVEIIPPKEGNGGLRLIYGNGVELIHESTSDRFKDCVFYGSEGTLFVARGGISADPKIAVNSAFGKNDWRLPDIGKSHRRNWIDCIRSRKKPVADVSYGAHTSIVCSLANIGYRLRRELNWNPDNYRFGGDKEANALANRAGRGEWKYT